MGWVPFGSEPVNNRGESVFKGVYVRDLSIFAGQDLPLEDRIQAGTVGLIGSADRYDPEKGSRFSNYAWHSIEQSIIRAINYDRTIKIPIHVLERLVKINRAQVSFRITQGREADLYELAEMAGLPAHHVEEALEARDSAMHINQLDDILPEDPEEADLIEESFQDPWGLNEGADALYIEQMMKEQIVDQYFEILEGNKDEKRQAYLSRCKDILAMRFGLATGEPMTLEAIGAELDITRERVRQIESDALYIIAHSNKIGSDVRKRHHQRWLKEIAEARETRLRRQRLDRIAAQIVRSAHQAARRANESDNL
jgi:RNA polymerase sigma factor (sigma-70 family)